MNQEKSIKQYFRGKNVFLTGGSGFLGKGLLEKLLRSCPDIGTVYILLRSKKGKSLCERVDQIISSPLFDKLKKDCPENLKKIVPINGDATKLELGISEEDQHLLIEKVHIFYHAAATVKFDDFLKNAIFSNIRGTREAAFLALKMKNIVLFMHVSTTYCNIAKEKVIEEILYPSEGNWEEAINVAENCDEQILNVFSRKYIATFPNTYTYTKLLAEHCINDLLVGKMNTIVCRPSVVIATIADPFQGWIDNFNGPVGLSLATGSGFLRIAYSDPSVNVDYISLDNLIKIMIVASWYQANFGHKDRLDIYHASKFDGLHFAQGQWIELGKKIYWDIPFEKKIWFPGCSMTKCWYNYYVNVILFHMIPAFFIDIILRLAGYPPMIFTIQRKIYIANIAMSPFMLQEWQFLNKKTITLLDTIPESEMADFYFKIIPNSDEEVYQYISNSCDYSRRYLLKEYHDVKEKTRVTTRRMYYLDRTIKLVILGLIVWKIFFKMNAIGVFTNTLCDYWASL